MQDESRCVTTSKRWLFEVEVDPDGYAGEGYVKVTDIVAKLRTGDHFKGAYRPNARLFHEVVGECIGRLIHED